MSLDSEHESDLGDENYNSSTGNRIPSLTKSISKAVQDKKVERATYKRAKSKDLKKKLDFLSKNIDRINRESKEFYRTFLTGLVSQNLRDSELNKISENLKEIDFAEPDSLAGMYEYRLKDENDKVLVSMEVTREYREGKIDPRKGQGQ